jgi:hypothetical protein
MKYTSYVVKDASGKFLNDNYELSGFSRKTQQFYTCKDAVFAARSVGLCVYTVEKIVVEAEVVRSYEDDGRP